MTTAKQYALQAPARTLLSNGSWAVPTPGHSTRDRGTIISDRADGRGVVVHSFNADYREVRDALGIAKSDARPPTAAERREFARQIAKEKAQREALQLARARTIADEAQAPEPGGAVRTYLAARGIPPAVAALAVAAGVLREHRDEQRRVSMLALAHDRQGGFRALQLTKLLADGSGKRGDPARFTFGPVLGASCQLLKLHGDTLAVAEGVETALAFYSLRKIPTWATFGTRNLQVFEPPRGVRTLIIAADGDAPGLEAAEALFDRHKQRMRCIIAAAPDGMDWLDVLKEGIG